MWDALNASGLPAALRKVEGRTLTWFTPTNSARDAAVKSSASSDHTAGGSAPKADISYIWQNPWNAAHNPTRLQLDGAHDDVDDDTWVEAD